MLYTLVINSILCFFLGYLARSIIGLNLQKMQEKELQLKVESGEYMPIVIVCDINDRGGYTVRVCNMNGIHATKENHDKFMMMLRWLAEEERKRPIQNPSHKFKLLQFKKDV